MKERKWVSHEDVGTTPARAQCVLYLLLTQKADKHPRKEKTVRFSRICRRP